MATGTSVLDPWRAPHLGWRWVAAELARLLALALVMSVAFGLLLTAAAIAWPAP